MIRAAKTNTFPRFPPWGCPGVEREPCKRWLTVWSCTSLHPEQEGEGWRDSGSTGPSPGSLQGGSRLLWLTARRTPRPKLPGKRSCSGGRRCSDGASPGAAMTRACCRPPPLSLCPTTPQAACRRPPDGPHEPVCLSSPGRQSTRRPQGRLWPQRAHGGGGRSLGWGRPSPLVTGLTGWWGNISGRRASLQPEQEPSGLSGQAETFLLVLSTAPVGHIFQLARSIFPWEGKLSLDKEVFLTKGGDSVKYRFHWPCLGNPLNQGRTSLPMGTQTFAYMA